MKPTNNEKIIQAAVEKAWIDPVFKQKLIAKPMATIKDFLGRDLHLPEGKKLAIVDQTDAATIFINIPTPKSNVEDMELNEDQLDAVSGGGDGAKPPIRRPNEK